jgi:hypothetical protein
MDERHRARAIEAISSFDCYHVVVTAAPMPLRNQERARARCLERLAWQLDAHGVQSLVLEARPPRLMLRDAELVSRLRSTGGLPNGIRAGHELPKDEPMLWVADLMLGAVGANIAGEGRNFDAIAGSIDFTELTL